MRRLAESAHNMEISELRSLELVERSNSLFSQPVIAIESAGFSPTRHSLSEFGLTLVDHLRSVEAAANSAAIAEMRAIAGELRGEGK
jgi:molybdenum-dependent DNA-binding transcriptional regulator ModE